MLKIDWIAALSGAAVGYLVKGKVESTKNQFRGIYTGAIKTLKESFSEEPFQGTQSQGTQGQSNGQSNGQH